MKLSRWAFLFLAATVGLFGQRADAMRTPLADVRSAITQPHQITATGAELQADEWLVESITPLGLTDDGQPIALVSILIPTAHLAEHTPASTRAGPYAAPKTHTRVFYIGQPPLGLDYVEVANGKAYWVVEDTPYGDLPLQIGAVSGGTGREVVKMNNFYDSLGWNAYTSVNLSELAKFADGYDSKYGYASMKNMSLDGMYGSLRTHIGNLQGSAWLMGHRMQAALLADNVYCDKGGTADAFRVADPASLGIDARLFSDFQGEGFSAALYQMKDSSAYVLAFRGTQFNSWEDWVNNLKQGAPFTSSAQYEQAKALALNVQNALGDKRVVVVGHSLGGGLGTAASIVMNRPGMTFNPAGLRRSTVKGYNSDMANAFVNVYRVRGEVLTTLQDANPLLLGMLPFGGPAGFAAGVAPNTLGNVRTLKCPAWNYNPVKRHDMSVVIEALGR